mgnify:CR=1 FL=1
MTDSPDEISYARMLLTLIGESVECVTIVTTDDNRITVTAHDHDGQTYQLIGDNLYKLALELAEQLGFQDMD